MNRLTRHCARRCLSVRRACARACASSRGGGWAQGKEIHVYWLGLDEAFVENTDGIAGLLGERYLSAQDWKHLESARDERTRRERLVSRAALRSVLERYVPGGLTEALARDPHGKPCLATSGSSLQFNLTHTSSLVGVCVGSNRPVGIDSENGERQLKGSVSRIAERRFSVREATRLESAANEEEKLKRFYRLWTLKEAFLKATGLGISSSISLRRCVFDFEDESLGSAGQVSTDISFEILEEEPNAAGDAADDIRDEVARGSKASSLSDGEWDFATFEPRPKDIVSLCWRRSEDDGADEVLVKPFRGTVSPGGKIVFSDE